MLKKIKIIFIVILILSFFILNYFKTADSAYATTNTAIAERLSGRLLLQVEGNGEIWYVNPTDTNRRLITLINSTDVFRALAVGITNADLDKLPTNADFLNETKDSDGDGYNDKIEAQAGYNLFGTGRAAFDNSLIDKLKGRLLLQVEDKGRIWYVNPTNNQKYEIQKNNVLLIFQTLALGINNENLKLINIFEEKNNIKPIINNQFSNNETQVIADQNVISLLTAALMTNDDNKAITYFTYDLRPSIIYTLDTLNQNGRSLFIDLLLNVKPINKTSDQITFAAYLPFNNGEAQFLVQQTKQSDGSWLITNL